MDPKYQPPSRSGPDQNSPEADNIPLASAVDRPNAPPPMAARPVGANPYDLPARQPGMAPAATGKQAPPSGGPRRGRPVMVFVAIALLGLLLVFAAVVVGGFLVYQNVNQVNQEYAAAESESFAELATKLRSVQPPLDSDSPDQEISPAAALPAEAPELEAFLEKLGLECRIGADDRFGRGFLAMLDREKYFREVVRSGESGYSAWEVQSIDSSLSDLVVAPNYFDTAKILRVEELATDERLVWAIVWNSNEQELPDNKKYTNYRFWLGRDKNGNWRVHDWQPLGGFCRDAYSTAAALSSYQIYGYNSGLEVIVASTGADITSAETAYRMIESVADNPVPAYMYPSYQYEVADAFAYWEYYPEAEEQIGRVPPPRMTPELSELRTAIAYRQYEYAKVLARGNKYRELFGFDPDVELMMLDAHLELEQTDAAESLARAFVTRMPEVRGVYHCLARLDGTGELLAKHLADLADSGTSISPIIADFDWTCRSTTLLATAEKLHARCPAEARLLEAKAHGISGDVDLQYAILKEQFDQIEGDYGGLFQAALYCEREAELFALVDSSTVGELFDTVVEEYIYNEDWEYAPWRLTEVLRAYHQKFPDQFGIDPRVQLWIGFDELARSNAQAGFNQLRSALNRIESEIFKRDRTPHTAAMGAQWYSDSRDFDNISESEINRARDLLFEHLATAGPDSIEQIWDDAKGDKALRLEQVATRLAANLRMKWDNLPKP